MKCFILIFLVLSRVSSSHCFNWGLGSPFISGVRVDKITFTNSACMGTSGLHGTCYTQQECIDNGGISEGACAEGHGVCCVFVRTCGESTCFRSTYFVNNDYPEPYVGPGICTFLIFPLKDDQVDQILLNFETFNLVGPTMGDCLNDSLIISGTTTGFQIPILCGNNTQQHMYLDVDEVASVVRLTISTSRAEFMRKWRIKVQQLNLNDENYAPKKCLQYFTHASGSIRSFNMEEGGLKGQLLNNHKYGICFKSLNGFCNINLHENKFDLSVTGRSGDTCGVSYLAVMGDRYCGQQLREGDLQVEAAGPIALYLNTGDMNVQEVAGINLDFSHLPCL